MWTLVSNLLVKFGLGAYLTYFKVAIYAALVALVVFFYFKWKSSIETAAIDRYRTEQVRAIITAKDQEIAILNGRVASLSAIQDTLTQQRAESDARLQAAIDTVNASGTTNQALSERMKVYLEELRRMRARKP